MGHFHYGQTISQYCSEYSETCIRQLIGIHRNCKCFLRHISVKSQKGAGDKINNTEPLQKIKNHIARLFFFSFPLPLSISKFCLEKSQTITASFLLSSNSKGVWHCKIKIASVSHLCSNQW